MYRETIEDACIYLRCSTTVLQCLSDWKEDGVDQQ